MTEPPLRVAVLGATGLVGRRMVRLLEARGLPVGELRLLGSRRKATRSLGFRGREIAVQPAEPEVLASSDLVLSSAGGAVSRELLPAAAAAGAVCIDNTSAFRMDPEVPLVVPEVNGHQLKRIRLGEHGAIVANPNCSTIQLVAALKPLHDAARVRRVQVSTFQSISGAGSQAVNEFKVATAAVFNSGETPPRHEGIAAFDVIPAIGDLGSDGVTTEEEKMMRETPKILEAELEVDVTCVRVPVFVGHAESVVVETEQPLPVERARELLAAAPGILVSGEGGYPTPRQAAGTHEVHVGRIRPSRTFRNGLSMWVVADNLLKGAALNAVQIAERLIAHRVPSPRQPVS